MVNEVAVGGKKRHVDIILVRWLDSHPLALDVTVNNPLAPGLGVWMQLDADTVPDPENGDFSPLLKGLPDTISEDAREFYFFLPPVQTSEVSILQVLDTPLA